MATSSSSHDISQEIPESERDITRWARKHKDIFQHDIGTLTLQTDVALKACKKISKEQVNIARKSDKEQSKQLRGCIAKYQDSISALQTACEKISRVVNNKNTKVPLIEKISTYDGRGKKRNKSSSFSLRGRFHQRQCEQCQDKDAKIMKLESDLERMHDDKEELLGRLQKEIDEKEDVLRRSNEGIEQAILKHELEIKRKEEECHEKTKEMEIQMVNYEEELKRNGAECQEKINKGFKRNAREFEEERKKEARRYEEESKRKETDYIERIKEAKIQIVAHEEELKRKEADCQEKIYSIVKRKVAENEEETKKNIRRYEEERKRKETEYKERMQEVTKRLQIQIEENEAAQRRIKETERQMSTLEEELKRKDAECQEKINYCLNRKIADHEEKTEMKILGYEEELKKKEAWFQESEKRMQIDKERLCSQLQKESEAKEHAQRRTEDADKTIAGYVVEIKRKETAYREKCRINEDMERKIQNLEEETIRKIRGYEKEIKRKELVYEESQRIMNEEMERLRRKLQTEINAKEDALRRFSSMASSKLRDNNPNITDLSDQNRPTKIAEKLSELYDNQWTDAFDALDDSMSEREIIQTLLDTLMKVYEECCKLSSENFYERIQNCIESPIEQMNKPSTAVVLPEQLKQQIKEFRKTRAALVVQEIEKVITSKLQIPSKQLEEIKAYISKCVWIGWYCAVQDPPLILSVSSSTQFDTNVFKQYTKRGPYVQFVVWPALLLHAQGALLCKGIAQGGDCPPENKTSLA